MRPACQMVHSAGMSRVTPRMLALAALLLLAVVAARGATSITLRPLQLARANTTQTVQPTSTANQPIQGAGALTFVFLLLGLIGLLLAVAALVSLITLMRRRQRVRAMVTPQGRELTADGGLGHVGPLVVAGRRALAQLRRRE